MTRYGAVASPSEAGAFGSHGEERYVLNPNMEDAIRASERGSTEGSS